MNDKRFEIIFNSIITFIIVACVAKIIIYIIEDPEFMSIMFMIVGLILLTIYNIKKLWEG